MEGHFSREVCSTRCCLTRDSMITFKKLEERGVCALSWVKKFIAKSLHICAEKRRENHHLGVQRLKSKTGKNDPTMQAKDIGAKRTP